MLMIFLKRLRNGKESSNLNSNDNNSTVPNLFEQPCNMNSDGLLFESITDLNNSVDNMNFEQRTKDLLYNEDDTDTYSINKLRLLIDYAFNEQPDDKMIVVVVLVEALKSRANAEIWVSSIKTQEKSFKDYFLELFTDRIVTISNDFHSNDNDDLRTQAISVGTLLGVMFNQNLLTWQNIEGHLQRFMAKGYVSEGSLSIIKIIFITCGDNLKKTMPAGRFNSLYSTYEENCSKISGSKTLSSNELTKTHVENGNQSTYADFEKIVIQKNPNFQNVMKHLNNADFNAHLDKYIKLIVSEAFKKPTLSEAYAKILSKMRFMVKKENVMELKLNVLLQNELTKYLITSDRNLKAERPKMQLQSQTLGNFIGELHKVDLLKCSIIESFFEQLLDKDQLREGCLYLICDIIQSCGSELKITLGTNKFNNYIKQLKRNTNPFNMSKLICTKVDSIKSISVNQTSVSTLNVAKNKNINEVMVQPSTSQSIPTVATSQLSNKDELLKKLKTLQDMNDGDDSAISKDLLNAYNEHNQSPAIDIKLALNHSNAIDNLSSENFEVIKKQLKDFKINTSEKVNMFADSIFQRILKDPEMNVLCAELCKDLFLMSSVSIKNKVREKVISLVNGHSSCVMDDLRLLRTKKNDTITDAHLNGFTQFNAEFFKVDLLPVNYVHTHLQRLLDLNHICESSVYQASVLLLSCGTELYNSKFQLSVLKRFVINMENFCPKSKTETEVRMYLKKVLELQQNNWQIIKTTTVKDMIKIQPKDGSSNEVIKSMISLILTDPSSTSKCVQDLVKLDDKSRVDLLMVQCKDELVKYLKIVSLHTGKDELLALVYKIQNEEDLKKRKELKMILDCRLDAPKNALLMAKFIAELYNVHLLDNSIVVNMEYLLDYEYLNETTTECLCKFLITIGRKLMSDKQRLEIYHKYVKKLGFILNNQAFDMPSHVQNLIEEVIGLEVKLMLK